MAPPVVTSNYAEYRFGQPGAYPAFNSDVPAIFSTDAGTLYTPPTPPLTPYTGGYTQDVNLGVPNETRLITVTATSLGAEVGAKVLQVYATLGLTPDKPVEVVDEEAALKTYAADKKTFEVKYFGTGTVGKWSLNFTARPNAEYDALRAFKALHRLHVPFYLVEGIFNETLLVCFDSEVKRTGGGVNLIDFSVIVRQY